MSHLTTSANTKTDAGAPGLTGTSPGQDIGTDEFQDQSNTKQEPKHAKDHTDKSTKYASSESQSKSTTEEKSSNSENKDSLAIATESPARASTPTPSGAPGATGASPNQPFGEDESRDDSPKVHDHHNQNGHSKNEEPHSSEKNLPSQNKSSTDSKTSSSAEANSKPSASGGSETDPGVTANTKTPTGAVGPTGTAPMEAIGNNESRDPSHNSQVHHKHDSHHSTQTTSSHKVNDITSTENSTPSPDNIKDSSNTSKESEFDGPNASFSSEIGSTEDPGRVAEKKMFERNAQRGDVGSMGVKQDSITGGGQFEVLESEEAA